MIQLVTELYSNVLYLRPTVSTQPELLWRSRARDGQYVYCPMGCAVPTGRTKLKVIVLDEDNIVPQAHRVHAITVLTHIVSLCADEDNMMSDRRHLHTSGGSTFSY